VVVTIGEVVFVCLFAMVLYCTVAREGTDEENCVNIYSVLDYIWQYVT
jgi:hypothetical protein